MAKFHRVNHINVTAIPGMEKEARWFYGTLLGLEEVPFKEELIKPYELIWFKLCDMLLHVAFEKQHVKPPLGFEEGIIMPGPHFAVEIEHLEDVRKLLTDNKCTTYDAVIMSDRNRFYGLDPFGNCIEFIEVNYPALKGRGLGEKAQALC